RPSLVDRPRRRRFLPAALHDPGGDRLRSRARHDRPARRRGVMRRLLAAPVAAVAILLAGSAGAQDTAPAATPTTIHIAYLGQHFSPKLPSSFMEAPPQDDG